MSKAEEFIIRKEEKIQDCLEFWNNRIERKKRLIEPYRNMMENDEKLNEKQYADFKVLEAEINLIKKFIEDVEYLKEG